MLPTERFRVFLFLTAIAFVYVLAAGVFIRFLLRKWGYSKPLSTFQRRVHQAVLLLALLGCFCIGYGFWVEPYWPEITHVTIQTSKLPKTHPGIRAVHISDFHCDSKPRLEERLPELISNAKPDLIIFTGDTLNEPGGLYVLKPLLRKLTTIAPTYVVMGNWDSWYWHAANLFGDTGVRELHGQLEKIKVNGQEICLTGIPAGNEGLLPQALNALPQETFNLFLFHYPDLILEVAKSPVDLYCAGHTHGGQIALPFYGALMTLSAFDKRFEAGLYRENNTWLYVNRGIGMEGGKGIPRVRFCARPEITVIQVVPK